jgi:LysM repeat protein
MKYLRGIPLFLLAAILLVGIFTVRLAAEDAVHVVVKGETVYSISRSYRVSPEELMRYNNITDASKLQVGKRLKIPPGAPSQVGASLQTGSTSQAGAPVSAYTEYRVVKGDTLFSIAREYGITVQVLRDLNKFPADYVLKAGERIKIPASGKTGTATVQSGQKDMRPTSSITVDPSLRWPVTPKAIAYMTGKLYGVVVQGERSEPVRSLTQGTVISAGPYRGFGRVAIVQVTGGYLYVYGGCENLSVKEGDRIGPGTELGRLGIDAVSEKPQLFFMVYRSNTPIDPVKAPRS